MGRPVRYVHRRGHVGLALLAWSPLAARLLSLDRPGLALVGGVVALWLATLPDVDLTVSGLRHRGPTHSIAFALATAIVAGGVTRWSVRRLDWSAVAGRVPEPLAGLAPEPLAGRVSALLGDALAGVAVSPGTLGLVVGAAAAVAVGSHVLGDALTPAGVELLWPISRENVSVGVVTAGNPLANYGFFACGSLAVVAVLVGAGVVELPAPLPTPNWPGSG